MLDTDSMITRALSLKTRAKNLRDRKRYEDAERVLAGLVKELEGALNEARTDTAREKLASELLDCWGLIGGVERRWGLAETGQGERDDHLRKSVAAYDKGYRYEQSISSSRVETYNALNRLVSRILLRPESLAGGDEGAVTADRVDVRAELLRLAAMLAEQVKRERRGDVWALADLGLVNLLLDCDDPVSAYAPFLRQSPPDYAYDSSLSVLRPLAELALPVGDKVKGAVAYLEQRQQQAAQG